MEIIDIRGDKMYTPFRDEKQFNVKINWDSNTAWGFTISLSLYILLIFISSFIYFKIPTPQIIERKKTIPIELLNFGDGDGTGISKGNLSPEGVAFKGPAPSNPLEDASKATRTKYSEKANPEDPSFASRLRPADILGTNEKNAENNQGSGTKNVGSPDGSPDGTGLGSKGSGPGLGLGYGDIEWGGGGNRIVLQKKIPVYPPGANTSAQIKIRFTVSYDGTVISMVPLQKGDPALEKAAMDALKQWRFNKLKEQKEMYGIITFTFKLS